MKQFGLDLLERARRGKLLAKAEWDFNHVMMPVRRLVKQYGLTWNKDEPVPSDPDLADRVFHAALELAESCGVYYMNTGTIIPFERGEIRQAMQAMQASITLGDGPDQRILSARRINDPQPPLVWAGNPGAPTPETFFLPMVMSWMQEPLVDLATCGSLTHVDGYEVRTGEPSEIAATRRELQLLREGLRRVGRPGMGLLAAQSSVSELGDLAAAHPQYLRPCDAHLVALLNELAFDQNNLARVVNAGEYGMRNASLPAVMVGGLGGDAPGSAVLQAASFLVANLVCQADYHLLHPIHIRHVATSTRAVLWVQAVVLQAFARNAPVPIVADIYPKSGALTREVLYEVAANAAVITACGGHLEGVGGADGAQPNSSGLECRWMAEVGQAVTRQNPSLEEVNRLVSGLLEKYEHVFTRPGGNPGAAFDQVYDVNTLQPLPGWQNMYQSVKEEVAERLPFLK